MELRIQNKGKVIQMTALGSDIPYRVDVDTHGKKYLIEPVEVHDMQSSERGGKMWAILINDVLYRPDCK